MLSDNIKQNEIHVPTRTTLDYFLHNRRAEIVKDANPPLRGGCGLIKSFHIKDTKFEFITKDSVGGETSGILQNEICCNHLIIKQIASILSEETSSDILLKIGIAFIIKYIAFIESTSLEPNRDGSENLNAVPDYQLIMEKAPGFDLSDPQFLNLPDVSDSFEPHLAETKDTFLVKNLRIVAQIGLALEFLHRAKIIHHDIKPSNFIYDPVGENIKVIDFGLSCPAITSKTSDGSMILVSYCSSIEEYQLSQKFLQEKDHQIEIDLVNLNSPAIDIYGLGFTLIGIFFRASGNEFLAKIFQNVQHNDCKKNIEIRKDLYNNLFIILLSLNEKLPAYLQYSSETLTFITNLIKSCLNPIPSKRPSAAQISGLCELFHAGMTDFGQMLAYITELRPSQPPSADLLSIYEKYGLE